MRADTFSFLPLTLNSPNTADHMGSYGPAFYQSYDGAGQFTYDFDGEQLFSVDLKKKEAVWRLPEFGNFAYFDPQSGLVSIAMIKAHLEDLVKRSNGTRAPNGTRPFPCPPPGPQQAEEVQRSLCPTPQASVGSLAPLSKSETCTQPFSFPGGSRSPQIPSTASSCRNDPSCLADTAPPGHPLSLQSLVPLFPASALVSPAQSIHCSQKADTRKHPSVHP